MNNFEVLILAAGNGTRMKTRIPKLLNKIKNQTILDRTLKKALLLNAKKVNVIINRDYESFVKKYKQIKFHYQKKSLGTGHAVKSFYKERKDITSDLLIMMGDAPSIKTHSIKKVILKLKKTPIVILGAFIKKNNANGMIELREKKVYQIKEFSFLKKKEKNNCLCNTGVMGIKKNNFHLINLIKMNKFKNEYLLTDIIKIAKKTKVDIGLVLTNNGPLSFGINTLKELKAHD